MTKVRVATVWFSGCAGCHMSFLDLDELLIDLAERIDIVKSPVVDGKAFPENIDVTLIEGAIANKEHYELVREIRERSKIVIAMGDCAVTGNVPAMRNGISVNELLEGVYGNERTTTGTIPNEVVPTLLARVRPVHEVIHVDYFLHGCPPPAAVIGKALLALLDGKTPELTGRELKFG